MDPHEGRIIARGSVMNEASFKADEGSSAKVSVKSKCCLRQRVAFFTQNVSYLDLAINPSMLAEKFRVMVTTVSGVDPATTVESAALNPWALGGQHQARPQ